MFQFYLHIVWLGPGSLHLSPDYSRIDVDGYYLALSGIVPSSGEPGTKIKGLKNANPTLGPPGLSDASALAFGFQAVLNLLGLGRFIVVPVLSQC